jgi:FkbM family methyltransferase
MNFASATRRFVRGHFLRLMRTAPTASALAFVPLARRHGVKVHATKDGVALIRGDQVIRVSHQHQFYIPDIVAAFDYFHGAVEPCVRSGMLIVDYSKPAAHKVRGYSLHPIVFASIPEPAETAFEYMRLVGLKAEETVVDLGAYAGLTSILFDQRVGRGGKVVAVDADEANSASVRQNLAAYHATTGRTVEFLQAAIWREDGELAFSNEGAMGSSAVECVGNGRARQITVKAKTLTTLAEDLALPRIDFIKCDIEGAEAEIFDQPRFFARYRPRIVIEVHLIGGKLTSDACRRAIGRFGYRFEEVGQPGSHLPLLVCLPV